MGDGAVFWPTRLLSNVLAMGVGFGGKEKYLLGGQIGTTAMFFVKSMELLSHGDVPALPLKNVIFLYSFIAGVLAVVFWRITLICKK